MDFNDFLLYYNEGILEDNMTMQDLSYDVSQTIFDMILIVYLFLFISFLGESTKSEFYTNSQSETIP